MAAETAKLIAALTLKDGFTGPLKNMDHALTKFDAHLDKTQGRAYLAGQQIGTGLKNGARIAAAAIAGLAVAGSALVISGIRSASDLSETISKVGVVFKQNAAAVVAFGQTSATALGLSENAALSAAATYGNLFVSMGLTADKSKDMSLALVKLAADLASFNNIDPSEAAEKLRAGITGESEPLKTLGININETIIKQRALDLGLVKLAKGQKKYTDVLPAAARAQAAYSLILEQSKTAQGDFGRTQSGLANQTRILKANWEDLKATLGTPILPKVAKILARINALIRDNIPFVAKLGDKVADLFSDDNLTKGADAIKDIFGTVKSFLPAIQSAAEITGAVVKTSVDAFKSLPKEIQALAIAGLAVNKLTGGLVTNIAGGLISAVISSFKGLMNVNAAVVTVNGPVTGVPGLPAAAAGGAEAAAGLTTGAALGIGGAALAAGLIGAVNSPAWVKSGALNDALQSRGLTQAERAAQQYYTASAADQAEMRKHLAFLPSKADFESGNVKLQQASGRQFDDLRDAITTSTLSVDVQNPDEIGKAVRANRQADVIADRLARGIKDTGPSKTITPRLTFLAGSHSGQKDVAVANALASGFESSSSPAFKSTEALKKAIKAVSADIKTLPPKFTGPLTRDLDRLKTELARRTADGAAKTALAARAAGIKTAAAIRDKDLSVRVTVPVTSKTFINGRLLEASTGRFTSTIVGSKGAFAEFG